MSVVDEKVVDVSITELPQRPRSEPEFERTPPQDLIAEQSVLGGMLLSKDAIADVRSCAIEIFLARRTKLFMTWF
jgi:hypothetical protein